MFKVLLKLEINYTQYHIIKVFIENLNFVFKTMFNFTLLNKLMFVFPPLSHDDDKFSDYLANK